MVGSERGAMDVRCIGVLFLWVLSAVSPLTADTILLGDISYQPDTPITGLTSIFLDNFTDLADLGCSTTFPACGGINISGLLSFVYLDAGGKTQNGSVAVPSTGPGSTPIYEFNPTQITFESAILTGTISPTTFPLGDGNTFISTGSFISNTLTPDIGFANISVSGQEVGAVPEPAGYNLVLACLLACGVFAVRRRLN